MQRRSDQWTVKSNAISQKKIKIKIATNKLNQEIANIRTDTVRRLIDAGEGRRECETRENFFFFFFFFAVTLFVSNSRVLTELVFFYFCCCV